MRAALDSWLDACEAPEVQRIVLVDGPSVLGWAHWRELCQPYILGLVEGLIRQSVEDGTIEPLPTRPLAHALVAMADEAALYVVSAEDRPLATAPSILGSTGLKIALREREPSPERATPAKFVSAAI